MAFWRCRRRRVATDHADEALVWYTDQQMVYDPTWHSFPDDQTVGRVNCWFYSGCGAELWVSLQYDGGWRDSVLHVRKTRRLREVLPARSYLVVPRLAWDGLVVRVVSDFEGGGSRAALLPMVYPLQRWSDITLDLDARRPGVCAACYVDVAHLVNGRCSQVELRRCRPAPGPDCFRVVLPGLKPADVAVFSEHRVVLDRRCDRLVGWTPSGPVECPYELSP